jgi:hypothetical protein
MTIRRPRRTWQKPSCPARCCLYPLLSHQALGRQTFRVQLLRIRRRFGAAASAATMLVLAVRMVTWFLSAR